MSKNFATAQLIRTAAPLYRDVANALERAIRENIWKPGDQIPTEPELEAQLGASRGTLRMAISELVRKGLLHRQSGRGTFVLGTSFKSMERYFRYKNANDDTEILPQHTVLHQNVLPASDAVAHALGLAPGTEVAALRRLRHCDGEPFLIVDSYFSMEIWNLIEHTDLAAHRLYNIFRDECELYVVSADEYLQAGLANEEESTRLRIPGGSAVIRLKRIAHTFENRPIEYREAVGHGDRFHYHVRLE